MIYQIFHILLWLTTIILVVSGIDDLFIDLSYWFNRRRYKNSLPNYSEMDGKAEKPVALLIGAWKEYKVIGRTLTLALNKIKYSNYRIFVGVYPNDLKTVKVVRDIAKKDKRVIICLNVSDGPTTKADNLNNLYSCLKAYESRSGLFDIVLIHDSEDFIHPLSLKLFNYFIAYKGYYGIQIPVIPIKSKYGRFFHRTYCDAFAELHSKDLIVRQALGSFIPFAGTGMGFNRKAFFYLEAQEEKALKHKTTRDAEDIVEENIYSRNISGDTNVILSESQPEYQDSGYSNSELRYENQNSYNTARTPIKRRVPIKQLSLLFLVIFLAFTIYRIKSDSFSFLKQKSVVAETKNEIVNSIKEEIPQTDISGNPVDNLNNQLTKVNAGYYDDNLKVLYINYGKNTYLVQESSWLDENKANQRARFLANILNDENVSVMKFTNDGIIIYRVVLGEYNSLDLAKEKSKNLRKIIK